MTPAGKVTEFTLPKESYPNVITTGPEGSLWFTDESSIGRIATSGQVTEFPAAAGSNPNGITAGPEGDLWITETNDDAISKITTTGVLTEFPLSAPFRWPEEITAGREGNLWFTEKNSIGRITPSGRFTEFPLFGESTAEGITAGHEGTVWFTFDRKVRSERGYEEGEESEIGRITPSGKLSEFPLGISARGITVGPAGNLWFTDGNSIDRITPYGRITEFPLPAGSGSGSITAGPEGHLWFTEARPEFKSPLEVKYAIGRIVPERLTIENPMRARVRNGWVKLLLGCAGGSAARACRGTLRLSEGSAVLAHGAYRLSPEVDSPVWLRLTHHALALLSREHRLPAQEVASLSGGEKASGEVVLQG